jgi:tRNA-dihydrouridine synthase 3
VQVCDKGAGSSLLLKPKRLEQIVRAASSVATKCPITFKTRTAYHDKQRVAHTLLPHAWDWGASAVTLHGRTKQQRYTRSADWQYIDEVAAAAPEGLQVLGNGDVFSYEDFDDHMKSGNVRCHHCRHSSFPPSSPATSLALELQAPSSVLLDTCVDAESVCSSSVVRSAEHPTIAQVATCMIARGALIKPWIFTEIKEHRHWDISASERLDMIKKFAANGLEHWGSDTRGVENTRRFLLEWLSFLHRYIPVGLLEVLPQRMMWRPPPIVGRSDLETLLASSSAADWVRISEMLLGPAPAGFQFAPRHRSNAYVASDADLAVAAARSIVQVAAA